MVSAAELREIAADCGREVIPRLGWCVSGLLARGNHDPARARSFHHLDAAKKAGQFSAPFYTIFLDFMAVEPLKSHELAKNMKLYVISIKYLSK